MATNTGEGHREGAVDDRTQMRNPATGKWTKRDRSEGGTGGRFIEVKVDGTPFKGVAKETDERRN